METEDLVEQTTQLVKDLNINNDCLLGLRNMCKVNKYLYHTEFKFFSTVLHDLVSNAGNLLASHTKDKLYSFCFAIAKLKYF